MKVRCRGIEERRDEFAAAAGANGGRAGGDVDGDG